MRAERARAARLQLLDGIDPIDVRRADAPRQSLAHRIAKFPAARLSAVKDRINAIAARARDFVAIQISSARVRTPDVQSRLLTALRRGFQTRDAEMDLARLLGDLEDNYQWSISGTVAAVQLGLDKLQRNRIIKYQGAGALKT